MIEQYLWDFRYLIIFVIALLIIGVTQWNKTKVLAYNLMLRAKQLAKEEILSCGKEQEDWVVSRLLILLPKPITVFLGEDGIRRLVEFLYNKGIDYLDDGHINNSIKK